MVHVRHWHVADVCVCVHVRVCSVGVSGGVAPLVCPRQLQLLIASAGFVDHRAWEYYCCTLDVLPFHHTAFHFSHQTPRPFQFRFVGFYKSA